MVYTDILCQIATLNRTFHRARNSRNFLEGQVKNTEDLIEYQYEMSHYLANDNETARDRRIDVTSGNMTYPLNYARYHQAEGQADSDDTSGHHRTAAEEVE